MIKLTKQQIREFNKQLPKKINNRAKLEAFTSAKVMYDVKNRCLKVGDVLGKDDIDLLIPGSVLYYANGERKSQETFIYVLYQEGNSSIKYFLNKRG